MPKTPKTQPKKQLKTKAKQKVQPKPVSITSRKSYWIALTLTMVVFGIFSGYTNRMAVAAIGLLIGSVLMLTGFAFYLNFYPSTLKATQRALYLFVGASIIGFSIWAVIVLLLNATSLMPHIVTDVGNSFFAITTLIICLISGAFIGDLIGKNKERLFSFTNKFRS
jgi:cation transport ATPase